MGCIFGKLSSVSETSVDDFGNLIGWDGDSIC